MKRAIVATAMLLLFAESAHGAWLLWKHSLVSRRVEGTPRGLLPEGNVDKWELLNAIDLRKECLAALKAEHKKSVDSLTAVYPNEPVAQSIIADGVGASVSAGAEKSGAGPTARTTQLYYEYTFWCLPAGVDPKLIKAVPERK